MIHLMGHSSELAVDGDFIRLPIGRDDVVVTRTADGLLAFDNLCPHRGARIFDGFWGRQAPRCAYHGRLARAETVRRFDVAMLGEWVLVEVPGDPACARCDFDGAGMGAIEALLGLAPLQRVAAHDQVYECPWPIAVENALDWTHLGHVHPDSLERLQLTPMDGGMGPVGSSVETFRSGIAASLDRLQPGNPLPCDYVHLYLAPYACVSSTRGMTISVQHYLPADGCTQFLTRLYAPASMGSVDRAIVEHAHQLNLRVFDEDAAICARVHPEAPAPSVGLEPTEWRIAYFRSVWRQPRTSPWLHDNLDFNGIGKPQG